MLHCIILYTGLFVSTGNTVTKLTRNAKEIQISQQILLQLHLYVSERLVPGDVETLMLNYSKSFMLEMSFTLLNGALLPASLVLIFPSIHILCLFFHCQRALLSSCSRLCLDVTI